MAEERFNLDDKTVEYHLCTIFEKLETLKNNAAIGNNSKPYRVPAGVEIRTLEFWRSVISECLASFVYIFIVCGAVAGAGVGASISSMMLASSLAAGFTMTSLTECFGSISGAHVNPAVTIALGVTKNISCFRTILFVTAQCGGAIAGAAFLYGVTIAGYRNNLTVILNHANIAPMERFCIEIILSYIVVFAYFVSMKTKRKQWNGSSATTIGATYTACSFVSMPYLNPARSLGPSFVLNRWDNQWIYWLGPIIGGIAAGITYEYIFNSNKRKKDNDAQYDDSSSIPSEEDTYDDYNKQNVPKFHGSNCNTYRTATLNGPAGYCPSLTSASLYSAPPVKLERAESLYGGTKSLYCKSPPLTRANLNRSQSVYTKTNSTTNVIPKPGPLVPAQSLYPIRLNHVQNQNVKNQMQQQNDAVYNVRAHPGTHMRDNYSTAEREQYRTNESSSCKYEDDQIPCRGRPESMYGGVSSQRHANQSAQSDDSTYSSLHGTINRNGAAANYHNSAIPSFPGKGVPTRTVVGHSSHHNSYHNQHSPNPKQY